MPARTHERLDEVPLVLREDDAASSPVVPGGVRRSVMHAVVDRAASGDPHLGSDQG